MTLTNVIAPRWFCCCSFYFIIEILIKINKVFWRRFTSIIDKYWDWSPEYTYPVFQKFCIIIFDCLLLITTPLLNRENSYMKCKYQRLSPNWWRSIATISLKCKDFGINTVGLGSGFLYSLQMLHCFVISSTIF